MNLPAGVTVEQWAAALRGIEHPWREGQRCEAGKRAHWTDGWTCECGSTVAICWSTGWKGEQVPIATHHHDIPMPAVTAELLMRMQKRLAPVTIQGLDDGTWTIWSGREVSEGSTLDAAIILATATLEVK